MDGRAAAVAQFEMAGDEVGVEVREEDVTDLEAELVSVVEILLDVALRVDDDGGVAGFVAEQVGGVGEAAKIVLFQDHVCSQGVLIVCPSMNSRCHIDCAMLCGGNPTWWLRA